MSLNTKTINIDGQLYQLEMLPTTTGIPIYSRLLKSLGPVARGLISDPAMRQLIEQAQAEGETPEALARQTEAAHKLGQRFVMLIVEAVETLPTEFLLELAKTFAETSKVTTKESGGLPLPLSDRNIFDQHFAGRYMHLTQWIVEHVKLNFTDFLASLVASVLRGQAASA
jgi:hypothetical protein